MLGSTSCKTKEPEPFRSEDEDHLNNCQKLLLKDIANPLSEEDQLHLRSIQHLSRIKHIDIYLVTSRFRRCGKANVLMVCACSCGNEALNSSQKRCEWASVLHPRHQPTEQIDVLGART